ncbi:MAG: hypothetical protein ACREMU_07780, partial [Gemmatimonadaceae bacterium]
VFTWDPFEPYEGHGDHRAVAVAASEAATFSHFPLYYPQQIADGLAPHYVAESWFFAKSPRDQNKFVDIDGYIDKKIEALYEHEAQMVLTIADMQLHLRASGLDVPWLAALDPHDYRETIARRMQGAARAVAARSGLDVTYAEAFRRTRYGGIESMAKGQQIAEDV